MRARWLFGVFTVFFAGACGGEDPELDTETTAAGLTIIGTWWPDPGGAQCEDYTSGNGQRVRGNVWLETRPRIFPLDPYIYDLRVEASNWNHTNVFGWNTKRTSALLIEGTVEISHPFGYEIIPVYFDTGGNLETRIGGIVWSSGFTNDPNLHVSVAAELTYYGRSGTVCSL